MTGVEADRLGRKLMWAVLAWFLVMALSIGGLAFALPGHESARVDWHLVRVTVLAPLVPPVECFEDLSCSDGSTLDMWDCARSTFVDERGRVVHSDGVCGEAP